jgi:hypothetical protein
MPSGKTYYEQLTKEQKLKYNANIGVLSFSSAMKMYCEDFRDFILMSFRWDETPEGRDYWYKIANSEKK